MKQLLVSLLLIAPTITLAADRADVARLVKNLSSADFRQREDATGQLVAAGAAAVDAVAGIVHTEDFEVSYRAIRILQALVESDDEPVQEKAAAALEKLAAEKTSVVAELASDALSVYEAARQDRAIEQLVRLGAVIPNEIADLDEDSGLHLKFGKSWHGSLANFDLLRQIPDLSEIIVYNIQLDDASLATIRQLPQLRKLKLYGTGLSDDVVKGLASALPTAAIDCRKGALLGIAGWPGTTGCRVHQIQPGTAAEAADIRAGDEIISFDGQEVHAFEKFTSLVSAKSCGDTVKIVLRRGNLDAIASGEPAEVVLTKEVTLGQWQ